MNINRYNYEEYFLLYTDNELSPEEKAAVEKFAGENPDLSEELRLLKQSVLRPEKHLVFTNKESLMKTSLNAQGINNTNYEAYFILYIDDELNAVEKSAVEAFLYNHPELEDSFEKFQEAKLQPEKISFPDKESLYRSEKDRRVIAVKWWKIAAAASVIIIAGWFWITQTVVTPGKMQVADQTEPRISTGKQQPTHNNSNSVQEKNQPINNIPQSETEIPAENRTGKQASNITGAPANAAAAPSGMVARQLKKPKQDIIIQEVVQDKELVRKKITGEVTMQRPHAITINHSETLEKKPAIVYQDVQAEIPEDNNATLTFAADHQSENVFLTNIPVDSNVPLRGFFRKASRVIHKVAAIKNGTRPGISIGNIEIAIQ